MITMSDWVDIRMQQHLAHEIYRQQIMQRIPDPFPPILPIHIPRHIIAPPLVSLPGVEVTLQNDDLWKQFHQIGTEMIITKSGRRMFPSMRLSISGLEDDSNYCILLEMVPIGDCRYKFSGSQWVPAGGAEPQSPQRMYLHADSPASGAHWQAQPILFNKVKLTNNTLDNNGQIVLASMHKYQPRVHIIRTSDRTQIPWSPQKAFVFTETEFVAVTAYQNDRITKLKIDNNPFAKGFRETGQSRCKRKVSNSPEIQIMEQSSMKSLASPVSSTMDVPRSDCDNESTKRGLGSTCSISSLEDGGFLTPGSSSGQNSPNVDLNVDLPYYSTPMMTHPSEIIINTMQSLMSPCVNLPSASFENMQLPLQLYPINMHQRVTDLSNSATTERPDFRSTRSTHSSRLGSISEPKSPENEEAVKTAKSNSFSISAILGS